MEKPLRLTVYSSKSQRVREAEIIPSTLWGGQGLLGVSIRFCSFEGANENVWHVLEVTPGSPADLAGLRSHSDFIIGADSILHEAEDLFTLIDAHEGRPLKLYVYNSDTDACREVVITPQRGWGGEGSLGCGIGYGLLHRIPIRDSYDSVSEVKKPLLSAASNNSSSPPPMTQAQLELDQYNNRGLPTQPSQTYQSVPGSNNNKPTPIVNPLMMQQQFDGLNLKNPPSPPVPVPLDSSSLGAASAQPPAPTGPAGPAPPAPSSVLMSPAPPVNGTPAGPHQYSSPAPPTQFMPGPPPTTTSNSTASALFQQQQQPMMFNNVPSQQQPQPPAAVVSPQQQQQLPQQPPAASLFQGGVPAGMLQPHPQALMGTMPQGMVHIEETSRTFTPQNVLDSFNTAAPPPMGPAGDVGGSPKMAPVAAPDMSSFQSTAVTTPISLPGMPPITVSAQLPAATFQQVFRQQQSPPPAQMGGPAPPPTGPAYQGPPPTSSPFQDHMKMKQQQEQQQQQQQQAAAHVGPPQHM